MWDSFGILVGILVRKVLVGPIVCDTHRSLGIPKDPRSNLMRLVLSHEALLGHEMRLVIDDVNQSRIVVKVVTIVHQLRQLKVC